MNIFILDKDPTLAVQYHCDVHIIKMIVETAQLLSSAHHVLDGDNAISDIYKKTHHNHPCAVWVRQSNNNYNWTHYFLGELLKEYTYRYNKIHKTTEIYKTLFCQPRNIPIDYFNLNNAAQAMPDEYKSDNIVESYRNYYKFKKITMPRFTYKNREIPDWLVDTI
jgi:hypothetical protein